MDNFNQNLSNGTSANTSSDVNVAFENESNAVLELNQGINQETVEPVIQPISQSPDIMKLEGTAHDKLIKLADLEPNFAGPKNTGLLSEEKGEENKLDPIPIEDKIMNLQSEIIGLLSENSIEKIDIKTKKHLLLSLNELTKQLNREKDSKKMNLFIIILALFNLLSAMQEKGLKNFEDEVKKGKNN